MPIPKHFEIRVPALQLLAQMEEAKLRTIVDELGKNMGLTTDELETMYPSGNGQIFYDRVTWALSYLNMADLLDKPKRGYYKINDLGRQLLATPEKVNDYVNTKVKERERPAKKEQTSFDDFLSDSDDGSTPSDKMFTSFQKIKAALKTEILKTIHSKNPYAFEALVVQLLQKMGYGGEIKDSGLVTSASNDGGIDGIIKEDVLGLGKIFIQAKRYDLSSTIGRDAVQKFAGALMGSPLNKGVFITTSGFSKGALEYVEKLSNANIILIDGDQLAEYIYDFGLGMQIEHTLEIKKMDSDFWDSMEDDEKQ